MDESITVSAIVGRRLREWREEMGYSQDQVARILRLNGLQWNRSAVAKLERGERESLTIEQLACLSLATGLPPSFFVGGSERWLSLADGVRVKSRALGSMFGEGTSTTFRQQDLEIDSERADVTARARRAWPTLDEVDHHMAELSLDEAAEKVARGLHVSPLDIERAAYSLWGVSLSDEREARVEDRLPADAGKRTRAAIRGHVTRALIAELEDLFRDRRRKR